MSLAAINKLSEGNLLRYWPVFHPDRKKGKGGRRGSDIAFVQEDSIPEKSEETELDRKKGKGGRRGSGIAVVQEDSIPEKSEETELRESSSRAARPPKKKLGKPRLGTSAFEVV